jgi:hypothetical protein
MFGFGLLLKLKGKYNCSQVLVHADDRIFNLHALITPFMYVNSLTYIKAG